MENKENKRKRKIIKEKRIRLKNKK